MTVDLPNYSGRIDVIKVHAKNKPLAPDVDMNTIARLTPGFSGQYFTAAVIVHVGGRGCT